MRLYIYSFFKLAGNYGSKAAIRDCLLFANRTVALTSKAIR